MVAELFFRFVSFRFAPLYLLSVHASLSLSYPSCLFFACHSLLACLPAFYHPPFSFCHPTNPITIPLGDFLFCFISFFCFFFLHTLAHYQSLFSSTFFFFCLGVWTMWTSLDSFFWIFPFLFVSVRIRGSMHARANPLFSFFLSFLPSILPSL
ncbi:hypothetical protein DFH27DRAFT_68323 [Peziza echinospora]|nr:hypothetical protein DFH27DRAFT_68323 [Peziza echinospora]